MKYFYSKEKISRLLGSLDYNDNDIQKYLKGNPFVDYPQLNNENTVITEIKLSYPTWTGTELREMTDEELKVEGLLELQDGEYIQDGKLIKVEYDTELGCVKPAWNKETHIWEETATLEEQLEYYKQEILKTTAELSVYEKVGFTNEELQNKLNKLTQKHNDISFELANRENLNF